MAAYKDREEFEAILSRLWDRILESPEIVESIGGVKIIARFRYTDYPSVLYIDNTGETPRYYWNPAEEVKPDVDMILSSETSHKFWMEDLNVPMAIAGRKIIPKGSVQKALKLIPALKPAFAIYPEVLKEFGRDDLLKTAVRAKRRRPQRQGGIEAIQAPLRGPVTRGFRPERRSTRAGLPAEGGVPSERPRPASRVVAVTSATGYWACATAMP